MSKLDEQTVGASPFSDGLAGDCPFSYGHGEIEPPEPNRKIKGKCVCCGENAYTQNPENLDEFVCWPCAYTLAN